MKLGKLAVLAAALAAAGSAHAFGIGVRAGTTGLGADVAWKLAPTLSARLGYSRLDWDLDTSTDRLDYDGKLKLSAVNAFLDFSPLGPFRITGGFLFGDNQFDVSANRSGGSISGTVEPGRSAAPYLGIGYGNVSGLGVNFYTDLGIAFHGTPKVALHANCGSFAGTAQCTTLQSEAASEQARLEDKLKKYKYYPVLNIGLTIGF